MQPAERIKVLVQLGKRLKAADEYRDAVIHRTFFNNKWFTKENQNQAITAIADSFLEAHQLEEWLQKYAITNPVKQKKIGLVLAGNIPLVGFHDVMCVFAAGHKAQIKLSDKDKFLLPYIFKVLKDLDPRTEAYFETVERLNAFDAVIATGSNNSARYFESYFGKYPNIIRKNRNAIAVLTGQESKAELLALGQDIFQYFGLGCRNVSKIYVPENYNFEPLMEALHSYNTIVLNDKYKNNFDYNYAVFVLNKIEYMANGCIILTENKELASHIAGLHYEYYDSNDSLNKEITARKEEIQCIVAKSGLLKEKVFPFGEAQKPKLTDYADGVDTMQFLLGL